MKGDTTEEQEEAEARLRAAEAALSRLDELRDEEWVPEATAERMHGVYEFRRQRFATQVKRTGRKRPTRRRLRATLSGICTSQARAVGSGTGSSA